MPQNMNIGCQAMHRTFSTQTMNANMPIKAYAMVLPEKISVQISAVTTGRMRMKQKEKKLRLNKV